MGSTVWVRVGAEIKRLRTRQGLTLEELAAKASTKDAAVDFSQLSKIERGVSSTNLEALERIAVALGVTLADLLPKRTHTPKLTQSSR